MQNVCCVILIKDVKADGTGTMPRQNMITFPVKIMEFVFGVMFGVIENGVHCLAL